MDIGVDYQLRIDVSKLDQYSRVMFATFNQFQSAKLTLSAGVALRDVKSAAVANNSYILNQIIILIISVMMVRM